MKQAVNRVVIMFHDINDVFIFSYPITNGQKISFHLQKSKYALFIIFGKAFELKFVEAFSFKLSRVDRQITLRKKLIISLNS